VDVGGQLIDESYEPKYRAERIMSIINLFQDIIDFITKSTYADEGIRKVKAAQINFYLREIDLLSKELVSIFGDNHAQQLLGVKRQVFN
jgi:hypothetical protein